MTLRIFLWSNFLGMPWTVVKVLRPLRSVRRVNETDFRCDVGSQRRTRDGARHRGWDVTYAGCGYGYRIPVFAWSVLRPRRRRRRDLYECRVSDVVRDVMRHSDGRRAEVRGTPGSSQIRIASSFSEGAKRTDGLEIFDGHKLWFLGVTLGKVVSLWGGWEAATDGCLAERSMRVCCVVRI